MEKIITAVKPDCEAVQRLIGRLCARYGFISRSCAGKTVLGRRIDALRIGEPESPVLFAAAFHGQEWLTALLLLTFAERLCEALDCGGEIAGIDCRRAMLAHGLVIVPCVNPDGVEIALHGAESAGALAGEVRRIAAESNELWNANARGVDINHNFDAGWHIARQLEEAQGIHGPSPRRYGGSAPESEPETQALTALCGRFPFRSVYAFHSQGEEIYWQYGDRTPPRSALIARVLAASSGYQLAQPDAIASHAGFKDWFISRFDRPGFTVEVGKGENPLPAQQLEPVYAQLEEMLMLAAVM